MKNYRLVLGYGDYTEIHPTNSPLEEGKVFASYKDAEIASNEHVEAMQAYRCDNCGGLGCGDCAGGWY